MWIIIVAYKGLGVDSSPAVILTSSLNHSESSPNIFRYVTVQFLSS